MVSRENAVILAFTLAAVAALLVGATFTDLSDTALFAVLLVVGIGGPLVVNGFLERRDR